MSEEIFADVELAVRSLRDDVPVNEAVEVFKSFCCSDKNPDLSEWIDITERIMKAYNINDD